MERTEPHPAVVCDAGPLIHLDEPDSVDLLLDFDQVLVPQSVWREVARALVLGSWESEALQLALQQPETVLLTDDAAARLAAEAPVSVFTARSACCFAPYGSDGARQVRSSPCWRAFPSVPRFTSDAH